MYIQYVVYIRISANICILVLDICAYAVTYIGSKTNVYYSTDIFKSIQYTQLFIDESLHSYITTYVL